MGMAQALHPQASGGGGGAVLTDYRSEFSDRGEGLMSSEIHKKSFPVMLLETKTDKSSTFTFTLNMDFFDIHVDAIVASSTTVYL